MFKLDHRTIIEEPDLQDAWPLSCERPSLARTHHGSGILRPHQAKRPRASAYGWHFHCAAATMQVSAIRQITSLLS